ncbi:hypothetical protein Tco_0715744, partial [Tanacetum coccineum]
YVLLKKLRSTGVLGREKFMQEDMKAVEGLYPRDFPRILPWEKPVCAVVIFLQIIWCGDGNSLRQTHELEISKWRRQQLNLKITKCKLDSPFPVAGFKFKLLGFRASVSLVAAITNRFGWTAHK